MVAAVTVALLGISTWIREAPGHGGLRDWEGSVLTSHVVLLMTPGAGVLFFGVLVGMLAGDSSWILLAAVPMLLRLIMIVWGGLFLPIPRWFLARDVRARAKARNS